MSCKTVVKYIQDQHGWWCVETLKCGTCVKTDMCGMQWYRIETPIWLRKYWNPALCQFKGGKERMFSFVASLPHDSSGKYIFFPRYVSYRIGNPYMYEKILNEPDTDPKLICKRCKIDTPPENFNSTLTPPCKWDITECATAQDCQISCAARWFTMMRDKYTTQQ